MERLKNITEFVVVSNLENRALNYGIGKAQNWWKNRNNNDDDQDSNKVTHTPQSQPQAQAQASAAPMAIGPITGQLLVTVLRAQDLIESRSSSTSDRPFVTIECNQQRFQTMQADSNSNNRNPQWLTHNGPFNFNIFNKNVDRLTVWIQQNESNRFIKQTGPKTLGICEIHIGQLIDQQQVWLPLRKDNKPVGQLLIQVQFLSNDDLPPPYEKI